MCIQDACISDPSDGISVNIRLAMGGARLSVGGIAVS